MPISFRCDQCGKPYTANESLAGKKIRCKGCGSEVRVPSPAGARPVAASNPPPKPPADLFGLDDGLEGDPMPERVVGRVVPRRTQQDDSGSLVWLWIACGGAAGLALLIGLIVMLGSSRKPAAPKNDLADADATGEADPKPSAPASRPNRSSRAPAAPAAPGDSGRFVRGGASAANLVAWRVQIDPPPGDQAVTFPEGKEFVIPIPVSFGNNDVLYPSTPSPFVCIGANTSDTHQREVWDLRDGSRVGQLRGNLDLNQPLALSPDGRYLVGHGNTVPRKTMIWSIADSKLVGAIEDGKLIPDVIEFAGPNQVLTTTTHAKSIQIWDFQAGKLARDFPVAEWWDKESFALSPGRRYVALASGRDARLRIYDLTTGSLSGEADLPREGSSNPDTLGMAFSPDGTLLSGLIKLAQKQHLVTWNVANGHPVSDLAGEGKDPFGTQRYYEGRRLQWLPDQSGWLVFDQGIVERQSGQRVWTLPFDAIKQGLEEAPRKLLDMKRAVIVVKQGNRRALRVMPLPSDKILAALELARSGGSAVDAVLPPLVKVDLATAKRLPVPPGDVAWSVRIDPAPAPSKPLAHRPVSLRAKANELMSLAVSDPTTAQAVVLSGPGGQLSGEQQAASGSQPRQVERINLATGSVLGRCEIPAVFDVAALSPDGSRLLLIPAKGHDRLDLVAAADGKPVVGWRPGATIVWTDFADKDHVLTVDAEGTLILWSVPEAKPVYLLEKVVQGQPALSPNRRALAVVTRSGSLLILDPKTGEPQGRASAPSGEATEPKAIAFRADGAELAALLGDALVRWDLKTGQSLGETPAPAPKIERLRYAGTGHLLLDNKWLYDLEHQRIVWVYHGGVAAANSPDGWHWYASGRGLIAPTTLTAIELPSKEVLQATSQAFAPEASGLIAPGATLAVAFEGNAPRDGEAFRQSVLEGLSGRLRQLGVNVAADAPARLVAKLQDRDTGRPMELRRFGGGPIQTQTVPTYELSMELTLIDNRGAPIPIIKRTVGTPMVVMTRVPPGENDLGGYLRQQLWQQARDQLSGGELPFFAARRAGGGAVLLPGSTTLGFPQRF